MSTDNKETKVVSLSGSPIYQHGEALPWSPPKGEEYIEEISAPPYADKTKFCGAIILPSVTVPPPFHTLTIEGIKDIAFFSVVPLYEGEMNLKLRSGTEELLNRFDKHGLSDIVDLKRRDVAAKRFGLW